MTAKDDGFGRHTEFDDAVKEAKNMGDLKDSFRGTFVRHFAGF